jgi:hypothetical protein
MAPLQDSIAFIVAGFGVLLVVASISTLAAQQQPQPTSVRQLCEEDMAKFCADAGTPQKMKDCMQGNARQLKPACRTALEIGGMLSK